MQFQLDKHTLFPRRRQRRLVCSLFAALLGALFTAPLFGAPFQNLDFETVDGIETSFPGWSHNGMYAFPDGCLASGCVAALNSWYQQFQIAAPLEGSGSALLQGPVYDHAQENEFPASIWQTAEFPSTATHFEFAYGGAYPDELFVWINDLRVTMQQVGFIGQRAIVVQGLIGDLAGTEATLKIGVLPNGRCDEEGQCRDEVWAVVDSLLFVTEQIPHGHGDTDSDGDVDITDLNNVRNNFGGEGLGDTNGDGLVNIADLNEVRNWFGASAGSQPVPEPNACVLTLLCTIVACLFKARSPARRRRSHAHSLMAVVVTAIGISQLGLTEIYAATFLYEDFECTHLRKSMNEVLPGNSVWTPSPPNRWTVDRSAVPGQGNDATDGVTEWAGWSFADKTWWSQSEPESARQEFFGSHGTIAVADSDQWDDAPHSSGLYKTLLATGPIPLRNARRDELFLSFDSSWKGGCCDDDPNLSNDQQAVVKASFDGGPYQTIQRWSSNTEDADYHADTANERITLPFNPPVDATSVSLNFEVTGAENDGWWGIDDVLVADERPKLTLVVEQDFATIWNYSPTPIDLHGYSITSTDDVLDPSQWESLTGRQTPGWHLTADPTSQDIRESSDSVPVMLTAFPTRTLHLGSVFSQANPLGLEFSFWEADGSPIQGNVIYGHGDLFPFGDTDHDWDVDIADLNNVRNFFGGRPARCGDADGDGSVGVSDLNLVRNNFGASSAVPEPSSLVLLAVATVGLAAFFRRRRN